MKLLSVLLWSLVISTSTGHQVLYPRQNSVSSSDIISSTSPTSTANKTPSQGSSENARESDGSATYSTSPSSRASTSTSRVVNTPPTSGSTTEPVSASTTTTNGTNRGDYIPLPLQPKITPAIGFAGAILMITGLAYTLVGIKSQWLYSFFGVTYLVSLATTVLIIYCMNPPVSNGVQGAFLVAVVFAGSLAGGVALIFRDLVDGIGCLLGGFCLAMWFLCLKADGLIPSILGKAIFIGCMSLAVFSLAISSKTRKYGLIGSIPFSGATATILGIDCFSRAGLKEFWIYIWNINEDEFPMNTSTYPMTRGIKVEVAGIILLFLLGLATQLKFAKVVEQRKQKKDARRIAQEKDMEREETAVGQRIEQDIQNEKVKWESIYGEGDKSQTTIVSGAASVDTLGKSLGSVREKRSSGMSRLEPSEMSRAASPRTAVTSQSPKDSNDEIHRVGLSSDRISAARQTPSTSSQRSARLSAGSTPENQPPGISRESLLSAAPEVVPLPFRIPGIEVESPRSNQGSLSAIEESYLDNGRFSSRRGSGVTYQRRSISSVPEATVSEDDHNNDYESDKDSSIAATLDELDQDDVSPTAIKVPRSPVGAEFGRASPRLSHRGSFDPVSLVDVSCEIGSEAVAAKIGATHKHATLGTEDHDGSKSATASEVAESTLGKKAMTTENLSHEGERQDVKIKRDSATTDSQAPIIENLTKRLPEHVSKVVLQYRTNEWAKHLELAEPPEQDGLSEPPSPGVKVDTSSENESSKERTPLSPVVDPDFFLAATRPESKRASTTSTVQGGPQIASTKQNDQPLQGTQTMSRRQSAKVNSRPTSEIYLPAMSSTIRNDSAVKLPLAPISTNLRRYSNPILNQPLIESPVESPFGKIRVGKMKRVGSDDMPSRETLLTQRDSQVKSMPRSRGFPSSSSSPSLAQGEFENASKSAGRRLSKPGPIRTASRQDTQPVITQFDSHQPLRAPNAVSQEKRADLMNGWRQSLRQERQPQALGAQAPIGGEAHMARLMQEQRQRQFMAEQEQLAKAMRDNKLDHMMRNGNMIEVHRQRLRNMQAGAKIL